MERREMEGREVVGREVEGREVPCPLPAGAISPGR